MEDLNNVSKYFNLGNDGTTPNFDLLFEATEHAAEADMAHWCGYLEAKKAELGDEKFEAFLSYVEQTSRYFAIESPKIKEAASTQRHHQDVLW